MFFLITNPKQCLVLSCHKILIAGRLARSQLNEDQVPLYVNEESNKRSNLLQKYVNLCNDAKVWILLPFVVYASKQQDSIELVMMKFYAFNETAGNGGDNAP